MLYLIAEDEYYYSPLGIEEITEKYNISKVVVFPTLEEIKSQIINPSSSTLCFLSPSPPSKVSKTLDGIGILDVVRLKNKHGFLTTGQKNIGISETKVLEEKLGAKIYNSTLTMKDYAGARELIDFILQIEEKEAHGVRSKGLFVVGIPGTGKSYLAKCTAGETGRALVELNLSYYMEMEDGLQALSNFFDFFIYNAGRYVIWIDEIEKMFAGVKAKQILGVLLTRLNDLGSLNAESSFIFIATANNVSDLSKSNPELFRPGRFDMLVFILNPTQENAVDVFSLHIRKNKNNFKRNMLPLMALNAIKGRAPREGTRVEKIYNRAVELSSPSLKEELLNVENNDIDKILEQKEFSELIEVLEGEFSYKFEVKDFMLESIRIYGEQCAIPDRYVHTQAEIENIVLDSFSIYYFSENAMNITELAYKYQPLQVTMRDSIQNMLGVADKFIKV